ncbi:MAG: DUF1223 domain-containing protein [Pseudomonadota bacterium]
MTAARQQTVMNVVELFTSQGCSSCPPADAIITDLSQRPNLLALSYHVDYWDYLGWTDPLGSADNTRRQQAYRQSLGNRSVYTPQAIINGQHDLIGSNAASLNAALKTSSDLTLQVKLGVDATGESFSIRLDGKAQEQKSVVLLTYFKTQTEAVIRAGENHGHTLTYTNSVISQRPLGMWNGGVDVKTMPMSDMKKANCDGCAVIVQNLRADGGLGRIIGADAYTKAIG